VHDALEGLSAVYAEHGIAMRAIADAARVDTQVEHFYEDLINRFVVANTTHIAEEIAAGRTPPMDPGETARALVWASEAYLVRTLGTVPPRAPREQVVETLSTMWVRVLYGD
jgi:TetR/AcrR family transcriptional regulator, ethionamide resistance regulator